MCFSATVSFSAAAALTVTAVAGIYFSYHANKRFLALNSMVLMYALQQFSEGMIWIRAPFLTLRFWGVLFLFIAFFVYPWFVGLSCYVITRKKERKKILLYITALGFIFGVWALSRVLLTPNLELDQCRLHIFYHISIMTGYDATGLFMNTVLIPCYAFFTIAPFFICDQRYTSLLGWLIGVSAVICCVIYENYFISVWCFYAAVIAGGVSAFSYWQWWKRRHRLRY